MIKRLVFVLVLFFLANLQLSKAQNPLLKMWDKNFGGLEDDEPTCFQQTLDGGFIIGGFTYSGVGGNKTEPLKNGPGIFDYWLIKTDSLGNKEWDRGIGGANGDQLYTIIQNPDSSFLIGGISASIISGDKTQPSQGNYDFWILKLDKHGAILWDKDFGGIGADHLNVIVPVNDGGFLLCGNSSSGIGGDKTQANQGLLDFWILKIDSSGNKLWDKTFGGSELDKLYTARQTMDGGFLLGGSSRSSAGGDKSTDVWGLEDYWIIRTDSSGNKIWDGDYGGVDSDILYSLVENKHGHIIAGGRSGSDLSGNKTQPLWGGYDFWILELDPFGNIISDKSVGGTSNEDEFGNVSLTKDGGYLFAGTSYSQISGDKTSSNLGQEQTWFLKYDSLLSKQWDKTVLTPCHDETGLAIQTRDQCYVVLNANGPNCGAGGERTTPSWNNSKDYWIVKYCDTTLFPPVAAAAAIHQLCPGTCTSFINLSLRSTSWQWNFQGASPDTSSSFSPTGICYSAPGSYDVTLIAYSVNGIDTMVLEDAITVYDYPAPQSIQLQGDSLVANAGASTYQWYYNGTLVSGATNNVFVTTDDGDYNVIATDSNGCEVEAVIYNVDTKIESASAPKIVSVFPNPVIDFLTVSSKAIYSERAIVYNASGEIVISAKHNVNDADDLRIDCRQLAPGFYFLELTGQDNVYRYPFVRK